MPNYVYFLDIDLIFTIYFELLHSFILLGQYKLYNNKKWDITKYIYFSDVVQFQGTCTLLESFRCYFVILLHKNSEEIIVLFPPLHK